SARTRRPGEPRHLRSLRGVDGRASLRIEGTERGVRGEPSDRACAVHAPARRVDGGGWEGDEVRGPAALLALEDGTALVGNSFGAAGETFGEAVFNTSMAGYQEVLTDPSYAGQIVSMTSPHQGNYGMNAADPESGRVRVAGFAVREA